ncbi:MAG: translation initiation factor [Chlamydiales bacterium]|nr:translation initiation factor [Chlamydiales bacterium]
MPFTVDGQWVPSKSGATGQPPKRPVKVRKEKRGNAVVTVVINLPATEEELKELGSFLKKRLGGGGTVKNGVIEVQGDKEELVRKLLLEKGIKAQ